jgi:hypothetical protein
MPIETLRPGTVVSGPVLPEAIEILAVVSLGDAVRLFGRGLQTGLARDIVLSPAQQAHLVVQADQPAFDGDARLFRLGLEAQRLGLAYEYDPFFSLSIARVDPLPHQLEAVYDYFLKLPRIRFLLADDPGAGKTIMAGLLLKEMKARGLVKRTLIVAPANLTFQWQRELKDKFGESFEVMRGNVLRTNYGQNPWQERSQVVTSVSWVSRVEDARDSLLRSRWDLVIVDEAHKMAAYADDRKTLAFKLGEALSELTDHYLLMTAAWRASSRPCGRTWHRSTCGASRRPWFRSPTRRRARSTSCLPSGKCGPRPSSWMARNWTSTTPCPTTSRTSRFWPRKTTRPEDARWASRWRCSSDAWPRPSTRFGAPSNA